MFPMIFPSLPTLLREQNFASQGNTNVSKQIPKNFCCGNDVPWLAHKFAMFPAREFFFPQVNFLQVCNQQSGPANVSATMFGLVCQGIRQKCETNELLCYKRDVSLLSQSFKRLQRVGMPLLKKRIKVPCFLI